MPKISVIVPVYNVEHYLRKCIESILEQTFTDFELLLIDDGSPDGSGIICDEYAAKDQRIRVVHKKNGGVSSARNLGLDMAHGEWITFVDADDWLDLNTLNTCLPFMGNNDIIRFSMNLVMKEDGSDNRPIVLVDESREEYLTRVIARKTILGVCGGLYLRKLFTQNNIRFDTSLISGEDWVVLATLIIHACKCKILNQPLYQYNKHNEGSCTSSFKYEVHLSNINALMKVLSLAHSVMPSSTLNLSSCKGKCDLIYDFTASIIIKNIRLKNSDWGKYANIARVEIVEIFRGCSSLKQFLVVFWYWIISVKKLKQVPLQDI